MTTLVAGSLLLVCGCHQVCRDTTHAAAIAPVGTLERCWFLLTHLHNSVVLTLPQIHHARRRHGASVKYTNCIVATWNCVSLFYAVLHSANCIMLFVLQSVNCTTLMYQAQAALRLQQTSRGRAMVEMKMVITFDPFRS